MVLETTQRSPSMWLPAVVSSRRSARAGQVQSFDLQLEVGQAHSLKISSARARLVVLNSGSIP